MPSIKDIRDELKKLGITKGYSKFTKSQLEALLKKAKQPHTVNTLQDRKDLLKTISKKDLLKVIRLIRIKNYYHLKHDDLVDLIASKYYSDFVTRWNTEAPDELLPYKPSLSLIKTIPPVVKKPRKTKEKKSMK